jgi:hypothetical protein
VIFVLTRGIKNRDRWQLTSCDGRRRVGGCNGRRRIGRSRDLPQNVHDFRDSHTLRPRRESRAASLSPSTSEIVGSRQAAARHVPPGSAAVHRQPCWRAGHGRRLKTVKRCVTFATRMGTPERHEADAAFRPLQRPFPSPRRGLTGLSVQKFPFLELTPCRPTPSNSNTTRVERRDCR